MHAVKKPYVCAITKCIFFWWNTPTKKIHPNHTFPSRISSMIILLTMLCVKLIDQVRMAKRDKTRGEREKQIGRSDKNVYPWSKCVCIEPNQYKITQELNAKKIIYRKYPSSHTSLIGTYIIRRWKKCKEEQHSRTRDNEETKRRKHRRKRFISRKGIVGESHLIFLFVCS